MLLDKVLALFQLLKVIKSASIGVLHDILNYFYGLLGIIKNKYSAHIVCNISNF